MRLHTLHRTRFTYEAPVRESFNEARLQPVSDGRQHCLRFDLAITPDARTSHYDDFHLNRVHLFEIDAPHRELVVAAEAVVVTPDEPLLPPDAAPAPLADIDRCRLQDRCYDFLPGSNYVEVTSETEALARAAADGATDAWQAAQAIMRHVHAEYHYRPASTNVHTHMREVIRARHGVCQDFAHVMIGYCRSLRIPARYVCGYLYNGPRDSLKGAQASHAWVEVFIDGVGWAGLDPTNAALAAGRHVKVAVGRDHADVSPLKGTYRGTDRHRMTVEVLVTETEAVGAAR
jgi:transglutaminase-like putative cysteine protease